MAGLGRPRRLIFQICSLPTLVHFGLRLQPRPREQNLARPSSTSLWRSHMAQNDVGIYANLESDLKAGFVDFQNDTFKVLLTTSSYFPDKAHSRRDDVTD